MTADSQRVAIAKAVGVAGLFVINKPRYAPFGYYRENGKGYTATLENAWKVSEEVGQKYTMYTDAPTGTSEWEYRIVLEPTPIPDYLNDLNSAFTFVEFLRGKGFAIDIHNSDVGWFVRASNLRGEILVTLKNQISLPRALSEVGLRAIDLWVDDEAGKGGAK